MAVIAVERLIEVIVALIPGWPLLRHLLRLNQRNLWMAKTVAGTVFLVAYVLLVVGCAFFAPVALHGVATLALIMTGIVVWRSRGRYGTRRGLPPGSLAPASRDLAKDQAFYRKQYDKYGPVFKASPGILHPYVCVVGHGLALDFLKTHGRDLVANTPAYNRRIPEGFLRYMAEADHRNYHKLFQAAMPPMLVGANEAALRSIMNDTFTQWAEGETNDTGVLVEPAVTALVFAVMAWLFFGIAADDPRYERLRGLHEKVAYGDKGQYDYREAEPALVEIERLVFDNTGTGVGRECILGRIRHENPEAAADATVSRNLIYMLETGHRDVAGLLTWVLKLLSENGAWLDRLRHGLSAPALNPQDAHGRTLADRIIMESLRLERSEYLFRKAAKKVRIGPFNVPKGWIIRICIREGHRTNPVFAEPDRFDPDRFQDRNFDRADYAPFGLYQRRCIGQNITGDVCRLFLEELFIRHGMDVVDDGPVENRNGHWHPNSLFRVRLV